MLFGRCAEPCTPLPSLKGDSAGRALGRARGVSRRRVLFRFLSIYRFYNLGQRIIQKKSRVSTEVGLYFYELTAGVSNFGRHYLFDDIVTLFVDATYVVTSAKKCRMIIEEE